MNRLKTNSIFRKNGSLLLPAIVNPLVKFLNSGPNISYFSPWSSNYLLRKINKKLEGKDKFVFSPPNIDGYYQLLITNPLGHLFLWRRLLKSWRSDWLISSQRLIRAVLRECKDLLKGDYYPSRPQKNYSDSRVHFVSDVGADWKPWHYFLDFYFRSVFTIYSWRL